MHDKVVTIVLVSLFGTLVVVAQTALGILGIESAVQQGTMIASGELTTAVITGQLARNVDAAYAIGEVALHSDPAGRSRSLGPLYASLFPAIDAQLSSLEQVHFSDGTSPAEFADLDLFIRQWAAVRDLLSQAGQPAAGLTLTA